MAKMVLLNALNTAIDEKMEKDPDLFMMAESTHGTVFGVGGPQILNKYGDERFIDCPISEKGFANVAIGACAMGKRAVVDLMFADFAAVTFHELVQEAPYMHYATGGQVQCPIVFVGAQGAGISGGCHHSCNVEGWFMNAPGLTVVSPTTADDTYALMKTALDFNNPTLFLVHKCLLGSKGEVPEGYTMPFGKCHITKEGKDVTIIAGQMMNLYAQQAAATLAAEGIDVEIIDPVSLRPFDREGFVASAKKTGRVLIVHEGPTHGGVGAEFAAAITEDAFADLKAPVARLGACEVAIPAGTEEAYIFPSAEKIVAAVKALMAK